jgi:hypothetical protein
LKKVFLLATFSTILAVVGAQAQQIDLGFGAGTVVSASSSNPSTGHQPQTIGGGTFLAFSGDFLFHRNFGVQGEVSWRASQNVYQGYQQFRPLFWDFNGMWVPKLGKKLQAEALAGIGAESVRFYNNYYTCSYFTGCTSYTSENHFTGHFGVGLRYYFWHDAFLRPEASFYLINGNNDFSSNFASRYGVTLGYSLGRR